MDRSTKTWQSPTWVHHLGWTLVFSLVFLATAGLILPAMIAAFLIGARLRTWWWAAGPRVGAVLVLGIGMLLMASASGYQPGSEGPSYAPAYALYFGDIITKQGALFGIPNVLAAIAGVRWGKHPEAANAGSRAVHRGGDTSVQVTR